VPETIITDEIRLKQVLMNLVSNAIKFTNEGRITITCSVAPSDGSAATPTSESSEEKAYDAYSIQPRTSVSSSATTDSSGHSSATTPPPLHPLPPHIEAISASPEQFALANLNERPYYMVGEDDDEGDFTQITVPATTMLLPPRPFDAAPIYPTVQERAGLPYVQPRGSPGAELPDLQSFIRRHCSGTIRLRFSVADTGTNPNNSTSNYIKT